MASTEKKLLEELFFFIENQEYNVLNGELLSFANTIQNKIKKLIESEINDLEDKKWTDSDLRATVSVVNNIPQWNLTYKLEVEIISHFDKLEKAAFETVKEKLLAIEKQRLYNENLTVINNLTDTLALEKADEYPPFKIGKAYLQNERFYYPINQKLYKVLQGHTSQVQWLPTEAVSLYVAVTPENVIAAWVQPLGAQDAYQIGDKVTYGGFTWESTAANNVWQPGVYGWVKI